MSTSAARHQEEMNENYAGRSANREEPIDRASNRQDQRLSPPPRGQNQPNPPPRGQDQPNPPPRGQSQSLAQTQALTQEQAESVRHAQAKALAELNARAQALADANARAQALADANARALADANARAQVLADANARAYAEAHARGQAEALAQAHAQQNPDRQRSPRRSYSDFPRVEQFDAALIEDARYVAQRVSTFISMTRQLYSATTIIFWTIIILFFLVLLVGFFFPWNRTHANPRISLGGSSSSLPNSEDSGFHVPPQYPFMLLLAFAFTFGLYYVIDFLHDFLVRTARVAAVIESGQFARRRP